MLFRSLLFLSPPLPLSPVRRTSESCLSLLFGELIQSGTGLDHILSAASLAGSPRRPTGFVGRPGGSSAQEPAAFSLSTSTHPMSCLSRHSNSSSSAAKATTLTGTLVQRAMYLSCPHRPARCCCAGCPRPRLWRFRRREGCTREPI